MTASLNFTMRNAAFTMRNPDPFASLLEPPKPPKWHGPTTARTLETAADRKPAPPRKPRTGRPKGSGDRRVRARRALLVELLRAQAELRGDDWTSDELAAAVKTTPRIVRRDFAALKAEGVAIQRVHGYGYRLEGGDHGR